MCKRKENESFEYYKIRRTSENKILKKYLKGRILEGFGYKRKVK